jgi:phosphoglycolate phosphatase-like HAD superfamily hydrolase
MHISKDTIYVGDPASDGECAWRAGVSFIGLPSGQANIDELRKFKPIRILNSIEDLQELNLGRLDYSTDGW